MKFKDISVGLLSKLCGNKCGICGLPLDGDIDIDHIIPISFGGTDSIDNLRVLHAACHKKRHATLRDIRHREKRGISFARNARYTGRPGKPITEVKRAAILTMQAAGKNITSISRELGISRPTIYEYKRKYEHEKNISSG